MRLDNVIAATAHLLTIMVLDSTVFTLPIGNLDATGANANPLSLLDDVSNLVNTLGAAKAHKARKAWGQSSGALGNRGGSKLRTH
jgi:hypothetical protein